MLTLVTGGGGFLGRYIVEQLLARGDLVRTFGRGAYPELAALGVEVIRGDLADRDAVAKACAGVDCVFHAAARAGVGGKLDDYLLPNVMGTRNVLIACRYHRVPRLVFTSSPSVTFAGQDQSGIDESIRYDMDWMKKNGAHYSLSKAYAETGVWLATHNRGPTRACALRPHFLWGPRDAHLILRLIARARSGRLRRVGDGTNLVDICYVENAAAAHLAAADALAREEPLGQFMYYISQGQPVNCWQWIDQILALAGLPPVEKSISFKAAWRLGAACESAYRLLRLRSEPPMTRFLAAQLAKSHWYDLTAARRDLAYEPKISTAEGIERLKLWITPH